MPISFRFNFLADAWQKAFGARVVMSQTQVERAISVMHALSAGAGGGGSEIYTLDEVEEFIAELKRNGNLIVQEITHDSESRPKRR